MRLRRRANQWFLFARLAPTRGAFRDRHERWVRDAMDAEVPVTKGTEADGEVVWARYPDADIKLAAMLAHCAGDGDKKARSPGRARRKP